MHIKDETAQELYDAWELDSKDASDIKSAIAEAFMYGAACGGMDSDLFEEALYMKYSIGTKI